MSGPLNVGEAAGVGLVVANLRTIFHDKKAHLDDPDIKSSFVFTTPTIPPMRGHEAA